MILDLDGVDALIRALADLGYRVLGPVVRHEAIVHGDITGTDDLPVGYRDKQAPGSYRLEQHGDGALFAWAVGPASWKSEFFPAEETVWRAHREGDKVVIRGISDDPEPVAIFGARPCELAAISVQDRVLAEGAFPDPRYVQRRSRSFVVTAECGAPAATCFCTSMGTGPSAGEGYDLALGELPADDGGTGCRYLVRVGSAAGVEVLTKIPHEAARTSDLDAREEMLASARDAMSRTMDVKGLPELLARNIDHPRWEETAERCLSCGNCTMVCPTCFCSDVHDVSDLNGTIERRRSWGSCFDRDHSYLHGGPVRPTTASSYRQWLTHKLSTWWDQFDSSGCVGCGRCISWCPPGIDITQETAAIRLTDGATTGGDHD